MTEQKKGKTSEGVAIMFGSALLAFSIVSQMASTYAAFFMTDILKISAVSMGLVLSIGGLFNTFGIFVIGGVVNNVTMKWGRYRSWMFIAPPILIISYVLFFMDWFSFGMVEATIIILLIVFYSIQQMSVNLLNLTTNGLAAVVGGTFEGRTKIVGRMTQFGSFARIIGGAVFLPIVAFVGGGNQSLGYQGFMLLFGIICLIAYLIVAKIAKPFDIVEVNVSKEKKASEKLSLLDMWKVLRTNDQFIWFIVAQIIMDFGIMFSYFAMAYFYQYVIVDMAGMALYLSTSTFVAMAGTLLGPAAWRLIKGKKRLFIVSMIAYAAAFILCFLISALTGKISNLLFLIIINTGIFLFSLHGAIKPSVYMDLSEYGFHKNGKEALPFMMSFTTLSFSIAMAVAGGALGAALSAAGYAAGVTPTSSLISSISFIVMGFPGISFLVAGLIFIFGYRLTDERVKDIMAENEVKRAELAAIKN